MIAARNLRSTGRRANQLLSRSKVGTVAGVGVSTRPTMIPARSYMTKHARPSLSSSLSLSVAKKTVNANTRSHTSFSVSRDKRLPQSTVNNHSQLTNIRSNNNLMKNNNINNNNNPSQLQQVRRLGSNSRRFLLPHFSTASKKASTLFASHAPFQIAINNCNDTFSLPKRFKGNWKMPDQSTSEALPIPDTVYSLRQETIEDMEFFGVKWETKPAPTEPPKVLPYQSPDLPAIRVRYRFWGYDEWIHVFPHRACLAVDLIRGIKKGERGPVALPNTRRFWSVKKSPFKYGYAQEHYDLRMSHYFFTVESTDRDLLKRFTNFVVNTAPASIGIKVSQVETIPRYKELNDTPAWMTKNPDGKQVGTGRAYLDGKAYTHIPHRDSL